MSGCLKEVVMYLCELLFCVVEGEVADWGEELR